MLLCFLFQAASAQADSVLKKIKTEADFRFRLEQDWDSRKSDGSYRDDRSRMRYRARVGFTYVHDHRYSFGIRLRTGDPIKQQDPQLTLGDGEDEFGTLAVGFEKAYFQFENDNYLLWLGKNTFPFQKNNELFWSDNVFPDGVFFKKKFTLSNFLIDLNAGHFIINSLGSSFDRDSYFSGAQLLFSYNQERLLLFPSFYWFNDLSNIPDGNGTFRLDYSILHLGSRVQPFKKPFYLEVDLYTNLEDYTANDSISSSLAEETTGIVAAMAYGDLKQKGDWHFKATYAYLQQFSAVDFLAQNDWARWDYSSFDSPDGRLTNLQGVEIVVSYLLEKNIKLTSKFYQIDQLVAYGVSKESNSRIRFDIDIKF